jgi:hypothetical protein
MIISVVSQFLCARHQRLFGPIYEFGDFLTIGLG